MPACYPFYEGSLTSPLLPSPALSKAKRELLGGQRAGAGGPELHIYPWGPQLCFLQGSYPMRPSQNQAVFQGSPFLSSPEHQNQHRVITLPSTEFTTSDLFLLGTFFTLSVSMYYLSASGKQQPCHLLLPFYLPGEEIWDSHPFLCCV